MIDGDMIVIYDFAAAKQIEALCAEHHAGGSQMREPYFYEQMV